MNNPLTLTTIDEDALGKIFEKLDFRSIFTLRKVCRDLRHYIDDKKPDAELKTVEIGHVSGESDQIHVNLDAFYLTRRRFTTTLETFAGILNFQKSPIRKFHVSIRNSPESENFSEKLLEILKSKQMKVSNVYLKIENFENLLSMMQFFDSNVLKTMHFLNEHPGILNIDRFVESEQWKNAKLISMDKFCVDTELRHFVHFCGVEIKKEVLKMEDVKFLKELFLTSPPQRRCFQITYLKSIELPEIHKFFGRHVPLSEDHIDDFKWLIKIENSGKTILVEMKDWKVMYLDGELHISITDDVDVGYDDIRASDSDDEGESWTVRKLRFSIYDDEEANGRLECTFR